MKKPLKIGIIAGLSSLVGAFVIYYVMSLVSGLPTLNEYQVLSEDQFIEVRNYPPILTAQVQLSGERDETLEKAKLLFEEFFAGGNNFLKKIDMHAPYFQQEHKETKNLWIISTPLPVKYKSEEIPVPNDKQIKFVEIPAQSYATISFSGSDSDSNIQEHYQILLQQLQKNKIIPKSKAVHAFYSPTWALGMTRRIDVMTFVPSDLKLIQED